MSYGGGKGRSDGGGRSRDYNRGSLKPKPVEVGNEYEVDITEISRQGDGIARVRGFVVFVKNGKVGNKVKVMVIVSISDFCRNKSTNHFNMCYSLMELVLYTLTRSTPYFFSSTEVMNNDPIAITR
jgi:predicted RNA-binding protein with TRAM domain